MISAAERGELGAAVSPVTLARVPTGMKAGVSTRPWGVTKAPRRARVAAIAGAGMEAEGHGGQPRAVTRWWAASGEPA